MGKNMILLAGFHLMLSEIDLSYSNSSQSVGFHQNNLKFNFLEIHLSCFIIDWNIALASSQSP